MKLIIVKKLYINVRAIPINDNEPLLITDALSTILRLLGEELKAAS